MSDSRMISIGARLSVLTKSAEGVASIPAEVLGRHLCILGTTGSGKSTCAIHLAKELSFLGVPTVILDRTGEYVDSLQDSVSARVLRPGENLRIAVFGLDGRHILAQVVDWISLLDHFYHTSYATEMSPLQGRVLREVFARYYRGTKETLTVSRLIGKLEDAERETQELKGWTESIEAIISRLYPLTIGKVGETFDRPFDTLDMNLLFQSGVTIVDLSVFPDDRSRNLLSQVILKKVFDRVRGAGRCSSLRLVMIIDESQHLAPNEEGYASIPERCAIELRKYGFSLVMIASRPSLLSPNIIANCNTLISHMLNNDRDIETVAGYFVGGSRSRNVKGLLRTLPVGHALIQMNYPEPGTPVLCHVGAGRVTMISRRREALKSDLLSL